MSFSNVNIGTTAGDHSGDPLRTAFNKINQNFSQISLTGGNLVAGVYSVNNRNGNVVLTVNDIPGAVTAGNVSTIVQSNLTNYATLSALANTIPNVTAIGTQITTAITAEDLPTIRSQVTALQTSIYLRDVDVDKLQIGNLLLISKIDAGNAASISANAALKSYVDYQDGLITTAWTTNAAAQSTNISTLASDIATHTGQIAGFNNDIASLTGLILTYPSASAIAGANAAIITANTALKGYVDTQVTNLTANDVVQSSQIAGANAAIITANTALRAYSDATFATLTNPTFPANVTINGNLFVNGNTTTINANTFTINDNIIYMANANPANTLDIGFAGHFNNGTYQHTGLVRQASTGSWKLFSNLIPEPGNTLDFTSVVYDPIQVGAITSPTITDLYANAAAQAASITTLTANAGAQSDAIALKAPIAGPSFTGNVYVSGNIVFPDNTYQSSAAQGSGLTSRTSIIATPTVLTSNVGGNINITGYKGYALYSIATSANTTANVWVTVYSNIAARTSDYSRSVATDPTPGTGIIAEVINVGNVTQYFTPAVYGFNNEATANTNVPLKVTVTSASTANVTVTVTMLKLEN